MTSTRPTARGEPVRPSRRAVTASGRESCTAGINPASRAAIVVTPHASTAERASIGIRSINAISSGYAVKTRAVHRPPGVLPSERRKIDFHPDLPARRSPPRRDIARKLASHRDESGARLRRPGCPYTGPDATSFSPTALSHVPEMTGSVPSVQDHEAPPIRHEEARAERNAAPAARMRPFVRIRGNESRSIQCG